MNDPALMATALTLSLILSATALAARAPLLDTQRRAPSFQGDEIHVNLVTSNLDGSIQHPAPRPDLASDRVTRRARSHGGTIELEGKLFYNDLRTVGHPEWRLDISGRHGESTPAMADSEQYNYLGALDVVAQQRLTTKASTPLATQAPTTATPMATRSPILP